MEELIIKTNEETIRLFIESAECEKAVRVKSGGDL